MPRRRPRGETAPGSRATGSPLSNAVRRFQGAQDVALSPLGARQAAALGAGLARPPVDATSTRARSSARGDTAEIALAGPRPAADAGGRPARAVAGRLGGAARWRRSARCPAIPTRVGARSRRLPAAGRRAAAPRCRRAWSGRHGGDRRRAPRRRATCWSSRHGGVISALPRPLARPAALLDLAADAVANCSHHRGRAAAACVSRQRDRPPARTSTSARQPPSRLGPCHDAARALRRPGAAALRHAAHRRGAAARGGRPPAPPAHPADRATASAAVARARWRPRSSSPRPPPRSC